MALKNISASLFFPLHKTVGSLLVLSYSFFIFSEHLTAHQVFGIILGILIPLILIHKSENALQINLKKGLLLMLIGTFFGVSSSSLGKVVTLYHLDPLLFIAISTFIGGVLSYLASKQTASNSTLIHSLHRIKRTGILSGLILFGSIYFFILATTGNLGIVYIINSFSILIPILLAFFIYQEHLNFRKVTAIFLTILSLVFLH